MPGGDRTGPMGAGPGTGRGLGYCNGYDQRGFASRDFGNRCGFGFWRGNNRGRRFRNFAFVKPDWASPTPEQEAESLKTQADYLKTQLDEIQKRIDELASKR